VSILNFPVLLTAEEVSKLLKVSVGTLAQWRSTKRYDLKWIRAGGAVRYDMEDVRAFVESRKNRAVGR
jgi:hypothetical protein